MIKVRIGDFEKELSDVREAWINEQISRRRRERQSICAQVTIDKPPLHMVLSTPGCGGSGAWRPPNSQEQRILELWGKHRLNRTEFTGGNLIAFLRNVS